MTDTLNPEADLITREAGRWRVGEIGDVEFRAYVGELLATVRAMEAERCAKVCEAVNSLYDRYTVHDEWPDPQFVIDACVSAIRSA